jgi:preprotein translocase subunit SecD
VTRLLVAALVAIATGLSLVGCSAVPRPLLCEVTIVALPADITLQPGDPLPERSVILAGPDDFDRAAIEIAPDSNNQPALNLELRGDAIARVGAHTAGHPGEFMAIAINGTVVAIPMIQGQIPDGKLQITGAGQGDRDLVQQFAGCVR